MPFLIARAPLPTLALGALVRSLRDRAADFAMALRTAHEVERLLALSDAELSQRGLSRDRVVHHVFAEYLAR